MNKQFIKEYRKDLSEIKEREEIRISAGELDHTIYEELEEDFRKAIQKYNPKIKIIAGPIISIDKKYHSNPILKLAEEELIKLKIAPLRQLSHFRNFGIRLAYEESYHEALSEKRGGIYSGNPILISRKNYFFDNCIDCFYMPKYNKTNVIKTTNENIQKLKESFGNIYDFMLAKDLQQKAKEKGIELF